MKNLLLLPILTAILMVLLLSCEKNESKTDRIDFEELALEEGSFWNGSDGSGGFRSGNANFPNAYAKDDLYEWWTGFSYSNIRDIITGDYSNQYASIAGSGAEGSELYAVVYSFDEDTITFDIPEKITNISLCNTTWAYHFMKEGGGETPKMGGEDGLSPDYFKLILTAYDEAGTKIGKGDIYLADFDPERVSQGYISNAWTDIDLSVFGYVKMLSFKFESNVKNEFGILIPQYVCIDNIEGKLQDRD